MDKRVLQGMNDKPYKYQVVRLKKEFFQSNPHFINMLDPGNPEKQMRRTYLYLDIQKGSVAKF